MAPIISPTTSAGLGDEPEDVVFQLALTVDGDHVTADFASSRR
jgi:hypothetical protein